MATKDRKILLDLNKQIKKLVTPPPTTFSPSTGEVSKPEEYKPGTLPPLTYPGLK